MVKHSESSAGLRGQVAGETALCTVEAKAGELTYRGYSIQDLAEQASFEEVAYLLQYGELPGRSDLDAYRGRLAKQRGLPQALRDTLEHLPASTHPMEVMRTGCSMLGGLEPERDHEQQDDATERMLGAFPAIICYWHHYAQSGRQIETSSDADSMAEHFLTLLQQKTPEPDHTKAMDASLVLYAEHEFNASTFAARVAASTLTDIYSAVTAAIGTLRGPLHGGANEEAMALIESFRDPDDAEQQLLKKLEAKEKIMGFGHAVYQNSDPRNAIIKGWAKTLAKGNAKHEALFEIAERCEEVMWREKELFANADFYHAPAYHSMGIPTPLFTPLFLIARTSGWTAHTKEQRARNRIIRPRAEYTGPEPRAFKPMDERD